MSAARRQPVRLADYRPPDYRIEAIDLTFDLADTTRVLAKSQVRRQASGPAPLRLDGEGLELLDLRVDGRPVPETALRRDAAGLTLLEPPAAFELTVETALRPAENTALEGLYRSNAIYCTQCEAEGFRRITCFPDRPDVLARYRVTIRADRAACPVLLSNGNLVAAGELPEGRHFAVWEDPFPKPSYLFALVAGRLERRQETFRTASGRAVELNIWVEPGRVPRTAYAMDALKRAMRWDEEAYGLEYDLDVFNIVAIDDFNLGAMENKSLNIFNARYILADPRTATDADHAHVETVVAHEYFHNWTGNRVTCRDWFQLSLKEGLTVFRDQQFAAAMRGLAVKRIQDVKTLRARQFPEDAGPLAHPVRPDSYIEINNFYTATVYDKGAELIRMLAILLGPDGFRRGVRLYLQRHDGQAATCDDFLAALADATGADLAQFKRWYSQAGTPALRLETLHDPERAELHLTVRQHTPATPGQPDKQPLHLPLALGLLAPDGTPLNLRLAGEPAAAAAADRVLALREAVQRFTLVDLPQEPVVSFNRGFAAPVTLASDLPDATLAFLFRHDPDPFNRWEAGQRYATGLMLRQADAFRAGRPLPEAPALIEALYATLADAGLEPAFKALLLTLPSLSELADRMPEIDVEAAHAAHAHLRRQIAGQLASRLLDVYDRAASNRPYAPDAASAGRRALKNAALGYLAATGSDEAQALLRRQAVGADNMTDRMAALSLLTDIAGPDRQEALEAFHRDFADDSLTLDKWFQVQAASLLPGTLAAVRDLTGHPAFSLRRPNKVRALIGGFAGNPLRFHDADGAGYRFLVDRILEIDRLNPQLAARLLTALGRWRRFRSPQRELMREQLDRVLAASQLSADLFEIATKALAE